MCSRYEKWFISSLCWTLIAIVIIILLLGVYSFIYYSKMDFTGKVSSGFSFLSSLSIIVSMLIYLLQKKDTDENKRKTISAMKNGLLYDMAISRKFLLFLKRAALNGRKKKYINKNTPNGMHCIKIQEMASSSLIFINNYSVNVMIPQKDRINSICSRSPEIDASIYQSSIDALNLIDKITIVYTHIKLKLSNDTLRPRLILINVNIASIEDIISTCSLLLKELKKIKKDISSL